MARRTTWKSSLQGDAAEGDVAVDAENGGTGSTRSVEGVAWVTRRTTWKSSLQGDEAAVGIADDVEVVPPAEGVALYGSGFVVTRYFRISERKSARPSAVFHHWSIVYFRWGTVTTEKSTVGFAFRNAERARRL